MATPNFLSKTTGAAGAGAVSLTIAHDFTGANGGIFGISFRQPTGTVSAVTCVYNGVSCDLVDATGGSTGQNVHMFELANPTGGVHNTVFSWTGASKALGGVMSFELCNVNAMTRTPVHAVVTPGTSVNVDVSAEVGDLIVAIMGNSEGGGSPVAGQTERYNALDNGGTGVYGAASTAPGAASVNMSYSFTSANGGIVAVALSRQPAEGGASPIFF